MSSPSFIPLPRMYTARFRRYGISIDTCSVLNVRAGRKTLPAWSAIWQVTLQTISPAHAYRLTAGFCSHDVTFPSEMGGILCSLIAEKISYKSPSAWKGERFDDGRPRVRIMFYAVCAALPLKRLGDPCTKKAIHASTNVISVQRTQGGSLSDAL